MTPADDLYRRLEVDPAARPEVVSAAYRVLAKALHPDVTGRDTTRDMAALNAAYDVLHDPVRRAGYDRTRQVKEPSPPPDVWMSFGRYRGQPISVVPTSYLRWAVQNIEHPDYLFDVTQELVRRGAKP